MLRTLQLLTRLTLSCSPLRYTPSDLAVPIAPLTCADTLANTLSPLCCSPCRLHSADSQLVLVGDTAVGKSSLVLRFVKRQFFEYQESTIGASFLTQTVKLDTCNVKFEIWDTAGT